jgi:hypothetical protein
VASIPKYAVWRSKFNGIGNELFVVVVVVELLFVVFVSTAAGSCLSSCCGCFVDERLFVVGVFRPDVVFVLGGVDGGALPPPLAPALLTLLLDC